MERLSIVNLLNFSQVTYRFDTISTKIPGTQFAGFGKLILKCTLRSKDQEKLTPWWGRIVKLEHFRSPTSRFTVKLQQSSPGVMGALTHRSEEQKGSPGRDPHRCIQLTPGEGVRRLIEKCNSWAFTCKQNEPGHLISCTDINSKLIVDLNIKCNS